MHLLSALTHSLCNPYAPFMHPLCTLHAMIQIHQNLTIHFTNFRHRRHRRTRRRSHITIGLRRKSRRHRIRHRQLFNQIRPTRTGRSPCRRQIPRSTRARFTIQVHGRTTRKGRLEQRHRIRTRPRNWSSPDAL